MADTVRYGREGCGRFWYGRFGKTKNMDYITDTAQHDEWLLQKFGCFSASNIYKLLPNKKTGNATFGQTAQTYIEQTACDAYTLYEASKPMPYAVEKGKFTEHLAYSFYRRMMAGVDLTYFGDANPMFKKYNDDSGGSPDCVAFKGDTVSFGCEFKCPERLTHLRYLRTIKTQGDLWDTSEQYYAQVQFLMEIFNCDLWHWCSYNEFFPAETRMLIVEVERNELFLTRLKSYLEKAIVEKNNILEELKNRKA